ncbi:MAG: HAMP domain-containing histidine kinase [Proteobacteria bacterium]|nr:MAG: HAMP domain-containing histidine kinase [Pseudomonadota bacterium]
MPDATDQFPPLFISHANPDAKDFRSKVKAAFTPAIETDAVLSNKWVHLALLVVLVPLILLFFRPTLKEFLGFYFIDLAAFFVCRIIDLKLFYRFYPETREYFPNISQSLAHLKTLKSRTQVLESMRAFPKNRSLYFLFANTVKVTPAFIYSMLVWGEPGSYVLTFVKAVLICLFTFSFATSMSYISYHNVMSATLKEIHSRFNWTDVIHSQDLKPHQRSWIAFEVLPISILTIFFFILSVFVLIDRDVPVYMSILRFTYILLSIALFIGMILRSSRKQIYDGMSEFVERYTQTSDPANLGGLIFSLNPLIAQQQIAINKLVNRILEDVTEKERLFDEVAERSSMELIGQSAAMFVHDVSKYIANISLSIKVLKMKSNPDSAKFTDIIQTSFNSLVALLEGFRRTIREDGSSKGIGSITRAFEDVKELNRLIFSNEIASRITFRSNVPDDLLVGLRQPALVHFLGNLVTNSTQNFAQKDIQDPSITLNLIDRDEDEVTLQYLDNGTGLSSEQFKIISGLNASTEAGTVGVGMKFTKRLIERHGGSIEVLDGIQEHGTCFLITFPLPEVLERKDPVIAHGAQENVLI